jgi:hypothetical protein
MKKYSTLIGLVVSLIVIFSAGFGAVGYFAKATELQSLELVVNYGFLEVRAQDLQKRMWAIEGQYGTDMNKWPNHVIIKYNEYKDEREAILRKLDIIFAQQKKGT